MKMKFQQRDEIMDLVKQLTTASEEHGANSGEVMSLSNKISHLLNDHITYGSYGNDIGCNHVTFDENHRCNQCGEYIYEILYRISTQGWKKVEGTADWPKWGTYLWFWRDESQRHHWATHSPSDISYANELEITTLWYRPLNNPYLDRPDYLA